MAALSSNDGRFAVKTLRITYQELIELADALESEKKDKSPKRKSKDNAAESSCKTDISPRKDEETVGQVDEEKSSDTKRSEKKSKDDKKSSKKRDSDKKKHKERSHGHGEEKSPKKEPDDEASENQNKDKLELEISNSLTSSRTQELNDGEVSEQQKCIEEKKHRKRTAKSKEKSGEETADLEDNEGKLQIDDLGLDNILAKDIKCKKKSKSKEEKTRKNSEFKTKGKKKSSHVEVDSENNTSEASAIVQKVLNTEEDEPEKDKTDHCKHGGGILKSPNSKSIHSHAHVSFSEKNESHVSEERGILRIPQGVNIHVDELRGSDCVDEYSRSSEHMLKKVDNDDSSSHISSSLQSSEESEQKSHKTDKHYESKTQTSEEGNSKMNTAEKRLRALNRQRAQQLTKQARHVEITLGNLLSKGVTDRGTLNKVFTLSNEIQDLYQGVIMLDLSFAQQQDIDQLLWKNAFYQVIETFRKYGKLFLGYTNQKDTISPEKINAELHDFLENSSRFYSGLLQGLQSTYHFEIQEIITQPRKAELLGRNAKLALLSCHHTLIFLGDIERYKEQLQPSNNENWSGIRSWYLKASKLAPKNGKPYNQLAVIAVYANRKLDAIFYYVRSLSVNSPILTAKEKLTTIYHEIQKKAEQLQWEEEMQRKQQEQLKVQQDRSMARQRGRERNIFREAAKGIGLVGKKESSCGRHEIWVFMRQGKCRRLILTEHGTVQQVDATGRPITRELQDDNEKHREPKQESPKISLQEVNKKYMLHFLCAQGLLYTRIGMDRLSALQVLLIGELHTLLRYPQCSSVGRIPLLQMSAVSMFAIEHTAQREDCEAFVRLGTPQDQALSFAMDMLITVLNSCTEVLMSINVVGNHGDGNYDNNVGLGATLRQYIPTVKVWFDWMVCHQDLWKASNISNHRTLWEAVAQFTNALLQIELPCFEEDDHGEVLITLSEDEFLAGFKPLSDAQRYTINISSSQHKELVEDHLHIAAVREFAMLVSSMTNPTLEYSEETMQYSAVIPSVPASTGQMNSCVAVHIDVEHVDDQESYESHEVIIEGGLENTDLGDEPDKGFKELKAKKDKLTRELEDQKEKHSKARAVVHDNVSRAHLMFENNPSYLVPDTNCFIDQLSGLQAILMSSDFTLVVPIVVINELDGLKKDFMVNKYHDFNHAQMVMNNARAAIDFLEDQFSLRSPYVKALTSKGTVMDTIAFRSEDTSSRKGNNDDVILSCCLHYCEENVVNKLATADQPITIRRNVVLLTDDRNLRVKAYTRNVPVLTVPQFRQMARL